MTPARTIARRVPTASDCSDVLTQLQRGVQLLRLYPRTHPHCAGAVQDAQAALRRFHADHGPLSVEVRRDGVSLEDVPVRTSGPDADLADLLYPEGVRALTFEEGVTQGELFGFLATLAGHGLDETVERDLLDALWRLELEGIRYMAHDELSPAAVAAERHDPLLRAVTERIRSLVAELEPGAEQPPTDLEVWLDRGPRRMPRLEEERLADARRTLVEPLDDPSLGDLVGRAAEAAAWADLASEEEAPQLVDLARFLAGLARHALWEEDVERAADLLARAQAGREGLGPAVAARLAVPSTVELLARALEQLAARRDPEEVIDLGQRTLSRLGSVAATPVARLLPRVRHEAVRAAFKRFLGERVDDTPEPLLLLLLTERADPALTRELVGLLARARPGTAGRRALETLAASGPAQAAELARQVLSEQSGEAERRRLLHTIETSPHKERRLAALARISASPDPEAFERLSALVRETRYGARDEDEVQAALDALSSLGGLRAVRVLEELRARRARFVARKETGRVSVAARAALLRLKKSREHAP